MLYVTYALNFLLMIAIPILLGWFLRKRWGLPWRLFFIGGVTFILSQVFHIPLNAGLTLAFRQNLLPGPPEAYRPLFNAVTLGLTAALTEELARYFVLRTTLRHARTWRQAVMFGAGHGGVEAILLGILAGLAYVNLVLLRQSPDLLSGLPSEQLQLVNEQLQAYWSAPWYLSLLGAVERVFALCVQISLAVLVMQSFLRRQLGWLFLAIVWHWVVDAVSVYSLPHLGPLGTEGIVALTALISLAIIFTLRSPESAEPAMPPEPTPPSADLPFAARDLTPDDDALDRSRYIS
ncbi:MAG: YhfC family intramembrane metalloprotease [Caldilineae bacterium]|nr:MAG: YhfC family intramembrane metalloprotease [Caldilineae bacterium]